MSHWTGLPVSLYFKFKSANVATGAQVPQIPIRAEIHSPVTRLSHEHVESLLQSYSLLLAEKNLRRYRQSCAPAIVARSRLSRERQCYLPLPQLLLKLEHPPVIVVSIVKRCHAARHSEVKKSKDDRCTSRRSTHNRFKYAARWKLETTM